MNFNHLFMCFALHSSITLAHSAGSFSDSDECPVFFVPSDVITNHLDSQQFEYTSDTMRYPPGAETMDQPGSTEAADRQSAQSHFEDIHDLHALSTASWLSRSPVSWYQAFSDTTDEIQRQALIAKDCDALSFFDMFCHECEHYLNRSPRGLDDAGFQALLQRSETYGIGLYYLADSYILTIVYIAIDGAMHFHHCIKSHDDT